MLPTPPAYHCNTCSAGGAGDRRPPLLSLMLCSMQSLWGGSFVCVPTTACQRFTGLQVGLHCVAKGVNGAVQTMKTMSVCTTIAWQEVCSSLMDDPVPLVVRDTIKVGGVRGYSMTKG